MLFYQVIMGGTSWHMKLMPVIFLFSTARDSFYSLWGFYWNPCLVRNLANVVKAYIISIPPPVIH